MKVFLGIVKKIVYLELRNSMFLNATFVIFYSAFGIFGPEFATKLKNYFFDIS